MPCTHCGDEKVYAKGWCAKCYNRQRLTGTLEYSRKYITLDTKCQVDGCAGVVVAKHLCDKHYRTVQRYGEQHSPFGYGSRQAHPLYKTWLQQRRTLEARVEAWQDFWRFVADVGEKPSPQHHDGTVVARRKDAAAPWGPDNFVWWERRAGAEDVNSYAKRWRARNPLKAKDGSLRKQYGITLPQYLEMYEAQQGQCAICGAHKSSFTQGDAGKSQTLVVDHCHASGNIRQLLCHHCNKALGGFKDRPDLLRKAAEYIERFEYLDTPTPA